MPCQATGREARPAHAGKDMPLCDPSAPPQLDITPPCVTAPETGAGRRAASAARRPSRGRAPAAEGTGRPRTPNARKIKAGKISRQCVFPHVQHGQSSCNAFRIGAVPPALLPQSPSPSRTPAARSGVPPDLRGLAQEALRLTPCQIYQPINSMSRAEKTEKNRSDQRG